MSDFSYGHTLSDGQEIALSVLYVISSTLSIMGSSTIIYKVMSDRLQATSYDRLLLGLSFCDLLASIGFALSPFLLPKETSIRVWAIGSESTCTLLGFFTQLGFSSVLYNGFLSYYYLFTIRYGVKRHVFARRYEPWFHAFTFFFSFITSTVGASMGFYSEVQLGMGCWVNDYPEGCTSENCISEEIAWFYGSSPVIFALVSLIVNNILVYRHVRKVFHTTDAVQTERSIRQKIQKREVATQGLFYVATFFFCFWSAICVRVMEAFSETVDERDIYWILVFMSATLPLQGFLNVFVYTRPNYKRVRAAFPQLSMLAAIRKACLDPKIPKLTEISAPSATIGSINKHKRKVPQSSAYSSNLRRIEEEGEDSDDEPSGLDALFETPGSSLEMEKWGSALPDDHFSHIPTRGGHDHKDADDKDKDAIGSAPSVLRFSKARVEMDGALCDLSNDDGAIGFSMGYSTSVDTKHCPHFASGEHGI